MTRLCDEVLNNLVLKVHKCSAVFSTGNPFSWYYSMPSILYKTEKMEFLYLWNLDPTSMCCFVSVSIYSSHQCPRFVQTSSAWF